ncbi:MAG: rhodanese-like domain-containing protein [Myxococcales bacterium]|nr:MAG: rhodanese-like domain-containing protein [Myxococcales bacterium]
MATNVKRVSPAEAHALARDGYVYVDVRSEQEFAQGHPAGAYNIPLMHQGASGMTPNAEFLNVMKANFKTDAKLVLGCRSGARSLRAAEELIGAGYTEIIEQRAGFDGPRDAFGAATEPGWGPAGLPVSRTAANGRSYAELRGRKS